MTGHPTPRELEAYRWRQLAPAELLSVCDHLDGCAGCRADIEWALDGDGVWFALWDQVLDLFSEPSLSPRMWPHLTFDQLADYTDGLLAAERLWEVKTHLSSCDPCALAAADLRDLREEVASELDLRRDPAPPLGPETGAK